MSRDEHSIHLKKFSATGRSGGHEFRLVRKYTTGVSCYLSISHRRNHSINSLHIIQREPPAFQSIRNVFFVHPVQGVGLGFPLFLCHSRRPSIHSSTTEDAHIFCDTFVVHRGGGRPYLLQDHFEFGLENSDVSLESYPLFPVSLRKLKQVWEKGSRFILT